MNPVWPATALGVALAAAVAAQGLPPTQDRARIARVEIHTGSIYRADSEKDSQLARLVNVTHRTTREATIRRELWFSEGDLVTSEEALELERNLRALGLFAEVSVELVPSETPIPPNAARTVDLIVRTRDRLSLSGGADGSFVGEVGRVGASLGEANLFGRGDRLRVGYSENTAGELRGAVEYRDRHLGDSWMTGRIRAGRTEEGEFYGASIARPFKHLADPFSWSLSADRITSEVDYFESGNSVAEVPEERTSLVLNGTWRFGPTDRLQRRGLVLRYGDTLYGAAQGPQAGSIDVPGDTRSWFAGALVGLERIDTYAKVDRLDTLGYVQDLTLGTRLDVLLGAQLRDETGLDERLEPSAAVQARSAHAIGDERYLTVQTSVSGRVHEGEAQGWNAAASVHAYELGLRPHTLAASLAFDAAFEGAGLPVELTLGGDSGVRGYPAREFSGAQRLRVNLEDRIDLGARLGSVDLGMVVFADAGWIGDRGDGLGHPRRSLGVGLRFGSTALLGGGVIRLDLAFPLDAPPGDEGPLLSLTLGQVFGFFGNTTGLSSR